MASDTPHSPEIVNRLRTQHVLSMAMLAGMQLELFTPLAKGPMSADELADSLGVDAAKLSPLLYALVAAELLTVKDGLFSNTAESDRFLVKGRPAYMGGAHELYSMMWESMWHTADTIRSGKPQYRHDFGAMDEKALHAMMRGMHPSALADGRGLAAALNLTRFRHLLDVGGGSGGLAIGACEVSPDLRATVLDLPDTVPITRRFVAEAGLADRIDVQARDLSREPAQGSYDLAVLRNVLQVLSREHCRAVLRRVGEVLEPGGVIQIFGHVLDDSRLAPAESLAVNVFFLNTYDDGLAYTEREHRDWLAEAGFTGFSREIRLNGTSSITAVKE